MSRAIAHTETRGSRTGGWPYQPYGRRAACRLVTAVLSASVVAVGCATGSGTDVAKAPRASLDSQTAQTRTDAVYGIRQIRGVAEPDIAQRQIPQGAVEDALTVAQLKAFADRCRTGTPPPNLDCSGLKLRVERLFRNDDEVARALTVLDRLGTPEESRSDAQARLFVQRAIAQGALLPEPAPEPVEPDDLPAPESSSLIEAIIATTGPNG